MWDLFWPLLHVPGTNKYHICSQGEWAKVIKTSYQPGTWRLGLLQVPIRRAPLPHWAIVYLRSCRVPRSLYLSFCNKTKCTIFCSASPSPHIWDVAHPRCAGWMILKAKKQIFWSVPSPGGSGAFRLSINYGYGRLVVKKQCYDDGFLVMGCSRQLQPYW